MKPLCPSRFAIIILSVLMISFLTLFYRSDSVLTESNSSVAMAPITVTKAPPTLTTDANGNGVVNPGDILTYSVTVANGATDATGVIFTDVLNSNLTLVPGSVNSLPIAANDIYSVLGNVSINVPSAGGVKANDSDPDGTTPTVTGFGNSLANANATAAGAAGTSAQGGNVTLLPDGSFSYNAPAGYEGTDSFFYTLRDAGADGTFNNADDVANTAQVTLNISGMIWFINNASSACTTRASGCGRLSNPYSTLAAFQAENNGTGNNPAAGDNIFIYTGSTSYDASVTLLNNQKLIGQGANTALIGAGSITGLTPPSFNATLPATGGTNPTIITTTAETNAVNLGQNNTIRGFTIGNTTGAKLNATANIGTANIGTPSSGSDVTLNGNGQAINFTGGGTLAARFASITSTNANQAAATTGITLTGMGGSLVSATTTITNPNGIGINVSSSTAGAGFDFGNTTVNQSGGNGVSLASNIGATTFADLDIAPDSGQRGLLATNNTGTITTTSGTITAATNTAIEVSGTSAASTTPLNMTLTTVSSSGSAAPNGIILSNTSGIGFSIVGTGSAGSGGTLSNKTGADGSTTQGTGIYLSNVLNVLLIRMQLNDFQNFAIRGDGVTNFTLRDSVVNGSSGTSITLDEAAIRFGTDSATTGIRGTALFEGNIISGGREDNLSIFVVGSDTLTVTVRDNAVSGSQAIFNGNHSVDGNDGFHLSSRGTSNVTVLVDGVTFTSARGDLLQVTSADSATQYVTVQNNTFTNSHPAITSGGGGLNITGVGGNPGINVTYRVHNNTFKGSRGAPIYSMFGGFAGTINGIITNNTVGTPNGVFDTTQANRGAVDGIGFFGGIDAKHAGTGVLNYALRLEGNTFRDLGATAGILLRSATFDTQGSGRFEATIKNNTLAETGNVAGGIYAQGCGNGNINTDSGKMGLDIIGNTLNVSGSPTAADAVVIDQSSIPCQFYFPGYTGPTNPTNQFSTYLAGKGNTWTLPAAGNSGTGGAYVNANISGGNLVLAVPTLASLEAVPTLASLENLRKDSNLATVTFDNYLDFKNISHQSPLEILASIEPFVKHSTNKEIVSLEVIKQPEIAIEKEKAVETDVTSGTKDTNHWSKVSSLVSNFSVALSEFAGKLGSAISPTVIAQETDLDDLKDRTKKGQSKGGLFAPEAGETVCVDGNTDNSSCAGGFNLPANKSTTITFRAVVNANSTAASIPNTANVTANGGININSNTVNTTVIQSPSISKAFAPVSIPVGGTSTLTLTLSNPNSGQALSQVAFTDAFPSGLIVASLLTTTNNCGGTLQDSTGGSLEAGDAGIKLINGTMAAGGSCTISVKVTSVAEGLYSNTTGATSSLEGGTGAASNMATLTVVIPPTISKAFNPSMIPVGGTSTVTLTLTNSNTTGDLTNASFTDSLSNMSAVGGAVGGTCAGAGTNSFSMGATALSFGGITIPNGGSCTITFDVTSNTNGGHPNQTSSVTTDQTPSAGAVSNTAILTVGNLITWTGATDPNWNTATNWNPATVPNASSDVLIPSGMISNEPGILTAETDVTIANLEIQNGRTLTIQSGRTLTVTNALTNNGTISNAGSFSFGSLTAGGTVNFKGTVEQSVPAGIYGNLTVNNAAGLVINGDVTVNNLLTLTIGNITTNADTLIIGSSGSVSRTSGYVIGNLRKNFAAALKAEKNKAQASPAAVFIYPVGTANGFSPATIDVVSGSGSFMVSATQNFLTGVDQNNSIRRYWSLTSNGITEANITFQYLNADVPMGATETNFNFIRRTGSVNTSFAPSSSDTDANTFSLNGVTQFSDWTLGTLAPTAASVEVGGQVVEMNGRGIANAIVIMTNTRGETYQSRTNSFGYYRFMDVPAGETYVFNVKHKRFSFSPQVVFVSVEIHNLNFAASP